MRYAIFSDIHGNRPAWEAVLRDMRQLEVQVMVCLGDVVGYGPKPQEVLRAIRTETDNILMGNHDAAASGVMDASIFNPVARQAIEWTRDQLDQESLSYLAALPMAIEAEGILFVHAEIEEPGRFGYIENADSARMNFAAREHQLTFIGHTHVATVFRLEQDGSVCQLPANDCRLGPDHRYIVNVGSVGEPRTPGDIRARYAIYDSETSRLYFRRIEFDPEIYRADLNASELEISPYFLTVFDEQREAVTATPAMASCAPVAQAQSVQEVRTIVMPEGVSATGPLPVPKPTRRRTGSRALIFLLPIIALAVGVGIFFAFRSDNEDINTPRSAEVTPEEAPQPLAQGATAGGEGTENLPVAPVPSPTEIPAPTPPEIPPETPPETPIAGKEPSPTPPDNPPAVPPKPELPAPALPRPATQGFGRDLVFYAPFDEAAMPLRDHAGFGREFTEGAVTFEQPGKIGGALLLQGQELRSLPRAPLEGMEGMTLSCWLRFPLDVSSEGVLLAWGEGLQLRVEGRELVVDFDRNGEGSRLALPNDGAWHHLLARNDKGTTQLSWDHRVIDNDGEERVTVSEEASSLTLGSKEVHCWMDELAIWAVGLPHAEQQLLRQRGQHGLALLAKGGTVAHWRFDEESNARLFKDETGRHPLGSFRQWIPVEGIAPDPVPLTTQGNPFGAQVTHVGEREEGAGSFRLTARAGFTYEGWFKFPLVGQGGTLGGTISRGDSPTTGGWRLAVRYDRGTKGFLAFMYETGNKRVQALARDVPLFDNRPHHIAATWNPGDSQGRMVVYVDNKEVAAVELPLAELHPEANGAFQIEGAKGPFTIDELRFSEGVLAPAQFLTAGTDIVREAQPKESLLERRDREIRERKAGKQPPEEPQE